jgi:hypothetical protein
LIVFIYLPDIWLYLFTSSFFLIPFFSRTRIEDLFSEYTYALISSNPRTENA